MPCVYIDRGHLSAVVQVDHNVMEKRGEGALVIG